MPVQLYDIWELDFQIQRYTDRLYKRAGGKVISQIHDMLVLNDLELHRRCAEKAQRKFIKDNK